MQMKTLAAQAVLSRAIENKAVNVEGDHDLLSNYLGNGLAGNCGFIIEGDSEKFAKYLLMSAAGNCGRVTEAVAEGECGFVIRGDYELAWSNKYFENAQEGNCGFVVTDA